MIVSLIVAAAANEVIGRDGDIPWHLPGDLRRFRRLTSGHAVVMGRLTHESILSRLGRPLPGRTSVVVSRTLREAPGVLVAPSVPEALRIAREQETGGQIFVIGGASVYREALDAVDRVHLTRVHQDFTGDTAMPGNWLDGFTEVSREGPLEESGLTYSYVDYVR
ncbi:dihydrofolate reductase [Thermomonospora echinospora]|uniref:Dihydrofolate reductase n=1 Tax=Thermomonospora echinospora TaxID=1992 RepID=A0A1H6DWB6_9ACTN|nr:dihydrofolate reductase [Thermomonospora echinospora]SEG89627.1 dihydrofolate reductase [Thermomonospora echinospora]